MAKQSKQSKQKKSSSINSSRVDEWLRLIGRQMLQGDYKGVVASSERVLKFLPQNSPQRVEVLAQLGTAHAILQNYPQSYDAFTEALSLAPHDVDLWYNRGMASRFTLRIGRSLRDFERAIELNTISELTKQFEKAVKESHKLVKMALKLRGPNFTLDQLIEQEDLFQRGLQLLEAGKWEEAAQAFQASIAMSDCLPQPWGNVGMCRMMQERYDEAEAALKRALAIDPKYTIAKNNLAALPEIRRTGPPKIVGMNDPFKDSKIKQSITFIQS